VAPRAAIPLPASHRRPPQSTYHWRLGQSKDGALAELTWLQDSWLDDQNSRLWTTNGPLNVVPKRARFAGLAHAEARPPDSAVYIDRPPVGSLVEIPINCLASRNSSLSRRKLSTWTVEAVVYFLDSPHLGRAWQGIIGRDGANFSRNVDLSTLYLKLDPERRFMLEAWLDDGKGEEPLFVSLTSSLVAEPAQWYSVVGQGDGRRISLYVNGVLVESKEAPGSLAVSPRTDLGDFTFGCAMYSGRRSDPCSCLLSEVQVTDHAVAPHEFLWSRIGEAPDDKELEPVSDAGIGDEKL